MWIERKTPGGGSSGARIGRVFSTKSGRGLRYGDKLFLRLGGDAPRGANANHYEDTSGDLYWISGCRADGEDALFSTTVYVDEDIRAEYWNAIRGLPDRQDVPSFRAKGKRA